MSTEKYGGAWGLSDEQHEQLADAICSVRVLLVLALLACIFLFGK